MIARLHGAIVETGADYLVIDTGGVGYKVRVPDTTATSLKGKTETTLHTEMIVRQDAILLYGFATQAELKVFRLLISVSRVGPQLATSILSRLRADQVAGAVIAGDSRLLATVPGVGKTGAERIVLELKENMVKWFIPSPCRFDCNAKSFFNLILTDKFCKMARTDCPVIPVFFPQVRIPDWFIHGIHSSLSGTVVPA